MCLSNFIREHKHEILKEWEDDLRVLDSPVLKRHSDFTRPYAAQLVDTVITDLQMPHTPCSLTENFVFRIRSQDETTSSPHVPVERRRSDYSINHLMSEYRALRTSVLKVWAASSNSSVSPASRSDMLRFNQLVDQALSESVLRFTQLTASVVENERLRLNAVLEAAPVGIGMADPQGRVLLTNSENRRIWGNHAPAHRVEDYGEWKGWWADGSERHGQPLQAHEWGLARALAGEEQVRDVVEIEPFGEGGNRRTVLLNAEPIRDRAGAIIGSVVAQVDITSQIKAEAALRESEAKFRTITNAMPQMVWSTLPDGYHDYYNRQWYEFTGVPEGSTDGEGWNGMFHPDDQAHAWEVWQNSLVTGEPYEILYRLRHHSGEYRWVLGRALPVRDEQGRILRWMGTCTDIHHQKTTEEELKLVNRRKDEFLAMLAHELRNPLAPISTAAQLLKGAARDETRVQQASEIIARQTRHLTRLVDDLLDVSRVTRGLVKLQLEVVDFKRCVRSAIEQIRPLIDVRQQQLQVDLGNDDARVRGDFMRLVQVIANVLNNASKFTPLRGSINVQLSLRGDMVQLTIRDNGIGIPASLLPDVFELFTQGERASDRSQGGLGLGLTLVKSITQLHGGRIEAASDGAGCGSSFTFILPRTQLAPAAEQTAPEVQAHTVGKTLSIMIVDDNPDAAQSLSTLLSLDGHQVTVKADGNSALNASAGAAVYILDIGLPDINGYEVARRLRHQPKTAGATLIALTGYGQPHDRVQSKAAGFDHHLVKPVDWEQLSAILARIE